MQGVLLSGALVAVLVGLVALLEAARTLRAGHSGRRKSLSATASSGATFGR
jgi:hypothetical protein